MEGAEGNNLMGMALPIVLFVLIFYFLILRPQKKQRQQHEQMINSIARGDTVVTAGGFFGRVSDIKDDSYILELAEGVKVRILKSSIASKRDGSIPSAGDGVRRKKKRRPQEGEEAQVSSEGEETPAIEAEGVTEQENEALVETSPEGSKTDAEKG